MNLFEYLNACWVRQNYQPGIKRVSYVTEHLKSLSHDCFKTGFEAAHFKCLCARSELWKCFYGGDNLDAFAFRGVNLNVVKGILLSKLLNVPCTKLQIHREISEAVLVRLTVIWNTIVFYQTTHNLAISNSMTGILQNWFNFGLPTNLQTYQLSLY